jgi:asparagine synthase (glutamine-hydrolysing)
MCGIFFTRTESQIDSEKQFQKLKHRGPDASQFIKKKWGNYYVTAGFHRLAINDLSDSGIQPFKYKHSLMLCNGEIYNHKELTQKYDLPVKTGSDCEVIIYLYHKFGFHRTMKLLDGVFALVIYDYSKDVILLGRDLIGVRPLYYCVNNCDVYVASEAKCLQEFPGEIKQLPGKSIFYMKKDKQYISNYDSFPKIENTPMNVSEDIKSILESAIDKRLLSDREIGCFLSGGVDSSIVAAVLQRKTSKKLKTFSIGFEGSIDLKYARKVAEHIQSDHYEYIMTPREAIAKIPEVIKMIETNDITTIRASVGMYILSEYISKNFKEVVIFSGEGSDELLAGYLYFHHAPSGQELFQETLNLVNDLPKYDVLRADRSTASHGLELRVPFLDKKMVKYCLSLSGDIRKPVNGMEKYYLRKAFEGYIPEEVLWRRKDGFSDGVSNDQKPWYAIIQEHLHQEGKTGIEVETEYYEQIYKQFYRHTTIQKFWLPKWIQTGNDPSGRLVEV